MNKILTMTIGTILGVSTLVGAANAETTSKNTPVSTSNNVSGDAKKTDTVTPAAISDKYSDSKKISTDLTQKTSTGADKIISNDKGEDTSSSTTHPKGQAKESLIDVGSNASLIDPSNNKLSVNDKMAEIVMDMKENNITQDDINKYSKNLTDKINMSIVDYFNQTLKSLDMIDKNKDIISDDLKDKSASLRKDISGAIDDFNKTSDQQKLNDNFEKISTQYISTIKDYKDQLDKKADEISNEKNSLIKSQNDLNKKVENSTQK